MNGRVLGDFNVNPGDGVKLATFVLNPSVRESRRGESS